MLNYDELHDFINRRDGDIAIVIWQGFTEGGVDYKPGDVWPTDGLTMNDIWIKARAGLVRFKTPEQRKKASR